jgi:methylglutaconyl-CoA hydratase
MSKEYTTIKITQDQAVVRVTLDRPDVRNAFDERMIEELSRLFDALAESESARVVVLAGAGDVFCAGADLNWMKRTAGFSYEENLKDALFFAKMMEKLYRLPQATVAIVQGPCLGGGVGLVSCCDIVVAAKDAAFALREVLLGIAPATISPYVLRKIGERWGRDYMLTGRKFDAARGHEIGLVDQVVETSGDLDAAAERWTNRFLRVGPKALAATKALINSTAWAPIEDAQAGLAEVIARLRASEEGQEGFAAFFEKRRPKWDPQD